jgi:hypothetical protein
MRTSAQGFPGIPSRSDSRTFAVPVPLLPPVDRRCVRPLKGRNPAAGRSELGVAPCHRDKAFAGFSTSAAGLPNAIPGLADFSKAIARFDAHPAVTPGIANSGFASDPFITVGRLSKNSSWALLSSARCLFVHTNQPPDRATPSRTPISWLQHARMLTAAGTPCQINLRCSREWPETPPESSCAAHKFWALASTGHWRFQGGHHCPMDGYGTGSVNVSLPRRIGGWPQSAEDDALTVRNTPSADAYDLHRGQARKGGSRRPILFYGPRATRLDLNIPGTVWFSLDCERQFQGSGLARRLGRACKAQRDHPSP